MVDLRYAITCEPAGERDIRVRTNQKTIKLSADSVPSRDEWVKAIRKVMFKAQNSGDSVKVFLTKGTSQRADANYGVFRSPYRIPLLWT